MAILNNSNAITATGGYDINNSLRFRASASAYLSRTPASAGNRKTWTYSVWLKRGSGVNRAILDSFSNGSNFSQIVFDSSDKIYFYTCNNASGFIDYSYETVAVFRDPSAWYHIVLVLNTANATQADRFIIYVNGVRQTVTNTYGALDLNFEPFINSTTLQTINKTGDANLYFDGYNAETNFIDGQALTPSSFGETDTTTGSWKPKAYTGTYGTNGFYLKFSDIATTSGSNAGLGKDSSGNGNYWTTNNISVTAGTTYDAMLDVPTNTSATVGNYCVWNPLKARSTTLLTNANLSVSSSDAGSAYCAFTSIVMSSQKWYAEYTVTTSTGGYPNFGIGDLVINENTNRILGDTNGAGYNKDGNVYINGTNVGTFATFTNNDVIGVAYDATNNRIYFAKNNTWINSGDPANGTGYFSPTSPTQGYVFAASLYSAASFSSNFGQRPFTYTPPTGFVALNTYNLPDSTIVQGNKYMDATTYTGNNASRSITNTGSFKPDFVWVKDRSRASSNDLVDSVRGVNKALISDGTYAEYTGSFISSFDSTGFSLPANTTSDSFYTNISGDSFVAWQWQAGQGSSSSNTSGSITSTVSVNTTAGFSVVTYTGNGTAGATVGHGLGVAPKMIINKSRATSATDWGVYHASNGNTGAVFLNLTNAFITNSGYWNNTSPASSVFTLGLAYNFNQSGQTYVAYCWAEIAGFSKFGSYTGNGSADGPFVYLGFRPKFVLIKWSSGAGYEWYLYDTARETYNVAQTPLFPNTSGAESANSAFNIDILSNGFKCRSTYAGNNNNAGTYIYMAFAENPFKNSLAR